MSDAFAIVFTAAIAGTICGLVSSAAVSLVSRSVAFARVAAGAACVAGSFALTYWVVHFDLAAAAGTALVAAVIVGQLSRPEPWEDQL